MTYSLVSCSRSRAGIDKTFHGVLLDIIRRPRPAEEKRQQTNRRIEAAAGVVCPPRFSSSSNQDYSFVFMCQTVLGTLRQTVLQANQCKVIIQDVLTKSIATTIRPIRQKEYFGVRNARIALRPEPHSTAKSTCLFRRNAPFSGPAGPAYPLGESLADGGGGARHV